MTKGLVLQPWTFERNNYGSMHPWQNVPHYNNIVFESLDIEFQPKCSQYKCGKSKAHFHFLFVIQGKFMQVEY
jgi:hypothetical protein